MRYKLVRDTLDHFCIIDNSGNLISNALDLYSTHECNEIKESINIFRSYMCHTDNIKFFYFDYRYIEINEILLEFNTLEELEREFMEYLI